MAKKIDPQAKAKRQKIMVAVGGVILLGVLAFQVPRTLKLLHQSSASASPATTTTTSATATGTAASATGTVGGSATATSAGSSDGLNDPNVLPAPQSGQLLAFSRFKSKDPFSQQIDVACGGDSGSTSDSGGGCGGSSTTQTSSTGSSKKSGPATGTTTTAPTGSAPAAKPTSGLISVNGASETVAVGAQFPASNPTFVLVSLTKTSAKISIAGGSLSGGKQTVTLKKGTPLTLENTTDGTRYVLRLVSVT
jgi:hypothetical protein